MSDEKPEAELARLRAEVARLEAESAARGTAAAVDGDGAVGAAGSPYGGQPRAKAATPSPAASGFTGGFFGCFGAMAAVLLCLVLLVTCSGWLSARTDDAIADGTASAMDYMPFCAAGIVDARRAYPLAQGAEYRAGSTPSITVRGPPARVVCEGRTPEGRRVDVKIEVLCARYMERPCVRVLSVD